MLEVIASSLVDGAITIGTLGMGYVAYRGAVRTYRAVTTGRYEKTLSRRSRSQNQINQLVQQAKGAKEDAQQNLSDLKTLQAEIDQEIKSNRDTIGTANHILEGTGEL